MCERRAGGDRARVLRNLDKAARLTGRADEIKGITFLNLELEQNVSGRCVYFACPKASRKLSEKLVSDTLHIAHRIWPSGADGIAVITMTKAERPDITDFHGTIQTESEFAKEWPGS